MKYKSELIKDIVDTRGHEKSSLHYESECVESWINEAKGAYPKLTDYESEWLNYIAENPIGIFPYEALSDITEATVNNVIPYAFKSAILKGKTLVNVLSSSNVKHNGTSTVNIEYSVLPNPNNKLFIQIRFNQLPTLVDGANRFLKLEIYDDDVEKGSIELPISNMITGQTQKFILDVFNGEPTQKIFTSWMPRFASGTLDYDIVLIEYQQGIENWDIPYFEGMQSVKMPVLTTTGKNLYPNLHKNAEDNTYIKVEQLTNGLKTTVIDNSKTSLPLNVGTIVLKPNTYYTISSNIEVQNGVKIGQGRLRIYEITENKSIGYLESGVTQLSFLTKNSSTYGIAFYPISNDGNNTENIGHTCTWTNIQIEEGKIATSYEPYKTNILTVNEPIELRGVGDVKDELNLLTGEYVQRIGEVYVDGTQEYSHHKSDDIFYCIRIPLDKKPIVTEDNKIKVVSDKIKTINYDDYYNLRDSGITLYEGANTEIETLYLSFKKSELDTSGTFLQGAKKWLTENPITVQYQLATPIIKTVDLNVVDQYGNTLSKIKPIEGSMHLSTDGNPIKPTFTGEVPIEAITQNLSSFIKGE